MVTPGIAIVELASLAGFGLAAWQAMVVRRKLAAIEDTPTTSIGRISVAGYYEVKGKVVCERPLMVPGGNRKCVYYRVISRRQVEESYTDSDGDPCTRTRTDESVTDEQHAPFLIEDRTGKLMVDPFGAEFRPGRLDRVVHDVSGSRLTGMASGLLGGTSDVTTASETRVEGILAGSDLYAIGMVMRNRNGLCLQRDADSGKPFILSSQSEAEIAGALGTTAMWWSVAAGVALLVAFVLPFLR